MASGPRVERMERLGRPVQGGEDTGGDLVDGAEAVDLDQHATRAVDVQQRRSLVGVDLLADPDGLFVVVGAALGLGPLEQPATSSSTSAVSETTASSDSPDSGSAPSRVSTCFRVRG